MIRERRPITRDYAEAAEAYLRRKVARGQFTVGADRVMRLRGAGGMRAYVLARPAVEPAPWPGGLRPLAWLCLTPMARWRALEVVHVWVNPEERRGGLATALYRAAIDADRLLVASGLTQVPQARALWAKFIREGTFAITARDRVTGQRAGAEDRGGEPWSPLPLYTTRPRISDVRLIARSTQ